ncbi:MAG: MoxR family ATPase [Planctomycetota bacterium]|nr:MoxR family ATPase [Planctomycetota bacterium]
MSLQIELKSPGNKLQALIENVERVIYGKTEAVRHCVVGLLAEGHILLEDVPGTGKTTLARALAKSIAVDFVRIQFTSDLLPADLIGVSVWSDRDERFVFRPGPIFGNIVLADELNRTTPRTQSALLECMDERRVSSDGETRELPLPFLVIATQNPMEFEGTYPLPESQLDRFLLCIRMGYPERDVERRVLQSRLKMDPIEAIGPVITREELVDSMQAVRQVRVEESLMEYVLDFTEATRSRDRFLLGASPRAALGWVRAAQAMALIAGRDFCVPDDFKSLAISVLSHRVVPAPGLHGNGDAGIATRSGDEAIAQLLEAIPVPG